MAEYIIDEAPILGINDIHISSVKNLLLNKKIHVNSVIYPYGNNNPTTLLCAAVEMRDYELIDFLISQNANVNLVVNGSTVLHKAIEYNNVNLFKKLYQLSAGINASIRPTVPLLVTAAEKSNYEIAEYLIEQGADANEVEPDGGMHPLHYACMSIINPMGLVKLLLDNNANVDAMTTLGLNPLMFAFFVKNIELVKLLINRGADINYFTNLSNYQKMIMVDALVSIREDREFIEYLLSFDEPMTDINVLYTGVRTQNLLQFELQADRSRNNYCDLLLDAGIDVDFEDSDGKLAVEYVEINNRNKNDIDIIKRHIVKLIAAGLPVCEKNRQAVGKNFEDFKNLCLEEIKKMKINKIGASNIYFLDVFSMSFHYLAVRLKFAELDRVIDKEKLRSEYPLYGGTIYFKLLKVERRIKYLEKLENLVEETLHKWGLPYTFIRELWYYFTSIELKKLTTVLKY